MLTRGQTPDSSQRKNGAVEVASTCVSLNTIPGRTSQGYQTLDVLLSKRRLMTEGSPANWHYS